MLRFPLATLMVAIILAAAWSSPRPERAAAQSADRNLVAGWNNVAYSGPPRLIQDAFTNILPYVESVWEWYPPTNSWKSWVPGAPPGVNTLDCIYPHNTYWIQTTRAVDWTFAPLTAPSTHPSRPIFTGWNNLSYAGPALPIEDALSNIFPFVQSVWEWDAAARSWRSWLRDVPSALNTLTDLTPDHSYWLRTTSALTWTFAEGAATTIAAGEEGIVDVPSEGADGGNVAVLLVSPTPPPRYTRGAPVLLFVDVWINAPPTDFDRSLHDVTTMGMVYAAFLWPGGGTAGVRSDGAFDYGGEDSIKALRDVARFLTGQVPAADGRMIDEILEIPVTTDNVGLYAFSAPGIAATNALALYGDQLRGVRWFVGRENPTSDVTTAVEVGHYEGFLSTPVQNPTYNYPADYSPTTLTPDYSLARWDSATNRPYFDVNLNGVADAPPDYILGDRVPSLFGDRCFSAAMSQALIDNGVFTLSTWPAGVCTPAEAADRWAFRSTPANYPLLASRASDLAVMLLFARDDHVQPAPDNPHIHQAYDGFTTAGLWLRLNPDRAYVQWVDSSLTGFPDNAANAEPADWLTSDTWATPNTGAGTLVPLAAVAEMADRTEYNDFSDNLSAVLQSSPRP